jgi:hypothetical protein
MAAKKKGGKKAPAKKSKPKKKKKTTSKKPPAKKTKKPQVVDAEPLSKTETAILELQEMGIKPFKDPMTLTSSELEQRTISLDRGKSQQEAELAACLYAIEEKNIPMALGFDRKDYYRERLGISYTKATEQAKTWRMLIQVGLKNIKILAGLSWTKLKIIRKGIANGKINARNLDIWLGRCIASPTSPNYVTLEALENMVKKLIAEADKAAMSKETKTVKFDVMAYEMDIVHQFEAIAQAALKADTRGAWYLQAIIDFSSNYANLKGKKDAAYWKSRGLASLKELVERTAPVAALFVPLADDITSKKIGVAPTSHIYQGYKDGGSDPLFCAAISEVEAKEFLGVKQVRAFPILVASSLMPKAPFRVEPERAPEPEKKKKKGKKAKESSFADGVKKMGKKEVNSEIAKLVKAMGINEKAYMTKKDTLEKDLPEGLNINQAILCWLYEEEAKKGKKKKASASKGKKKKAPAKKPAKKAAAPKKKRQRKMKDVDPKPKKKPDKKKGKKK